MSRALVATSLLSLLFACGSYEQGGGGGSWTSPDGTTGPAPTSAPGKPPPASPSDLAADPIVGLWSVEGTDARGEFVGEVDVRPDKGGYRFIRSVRYPKSTVEDGRELHWLFRGTLSKAGAALTLSSSLKRMDFITRRGTFKRTAQDGPLALTGSLTLETGGELRGTISGAGLSLSERWTGRKALPATPIFIDERVTLPAHAPPDATTKQTNFNLYANYHTLDVVKPFVSRPEFQAAVHGNVLDMTDFAFYRANKNALRVYDKVIDDISLAEARVRADSYRWTLAEKAERYEADIDARFVDPDVGMIPHGGPIGAPYTGQWESGDGSLWTAVYLASQYFHFKVNGDAKAKDRVLLTLDALLKLQEITGGDWAHFARTLRKPKGPGAGWHAGTGAYANLEWLEGGNNDMIKGLFYGYLLGWSMFCEGGKTGHDALCARIRTNTKHLADDVVLGGSNALASQQTNKHIANWMYAVMTGDLSYKAQAEGTWALLKLSLPATAVFYSQGIVDWSGTHLTFVGDTINMLLAERMNLGGDATSVYRAHIDASHKNLEKQRFPTWHLLKAAMGTGAGPSSPFIKDGVSRLLEAQYPKVSYTIDRRLSPDFCMSPYPSVPWKGDWMKYPEENRTQALNLYPLFETGPGINYWMTGGEYLNSEGYENPGGDFLHLYWFARHYGLIGPSE
ncbi:MAG: hypothetical protein IPG50_36925 [Myxococcales bacterium]|nr:hypothetical protein [Myxococcales bacterium]